MGLFDFFKNKRTGETVSQSTRIEKTAKQTTQFDETKESKSDAIVKTSGVFRCPFCNCDLKKIIDKEALPVYEVFKRMGPIAGSVTMDTAREQFIYKQGITCSCGKELKPYKK